MQLYSASSSYYSMIARLTLLEAGLTFEDKRIDIHFKKEQLTHWYRTLNPKMTVPTLIDKDSVYSDSRDILHLAADHANMNWQDCEPSIHGPLKSLEDQFYGIQIEKITFSKAMLSIPPLRFLFPRLLKNIIIKLNMELATAPDKNAVAEKIKLNQARIAFFTEGNLKDKLNNELQSVAVFLKGLPKPSPMFFGDKLSSADILTAVLLTRLNMIGETDFIKDYKDIDLWFKEFQSRPAFIKADMWLKFHPLRILLRT